MATASQQSRDGVWCHRSSFDRSNYRTGSFVPYPMYDSKRKLSGPVGRVRFYDVAALEFASRRTHDRSLVQLEVIGAVVTMSVRPSFVNLLAQSM